MLRWYKFHILRLKYFVYDRILIVFRFINYFDMDMQERGGYLSYYYVRMSFCTENFVMVAQAVLHILIDLKEIDPKNYSFYI